MSKAIELAHVTIFRSTWPDFPAGNLDHGDKPDFLLTTSDGKRIGIEHTRLVFEHPRGLARQSSQQEILDRADRYVQTLGHSGLHASVEFQHGQPHSREQIEGAALQLGDLVAARVSSLDPVHELTWKELHGTPAHEMFSSIRVQRFAKSCAARWWPMNAGVVRTECVDQIAGVVRDKCKLLPQYLDGCSATWLLIVASNDHCGDLVEFGPRPVSQTYEACFDRVFLLDAMRRRVHELDLSAPSPPMQPAPVRGSCSRQPARKG